MNLDATACPKSGGGRIFSCGGDFYEAAHKATTHELFKQTKNSKK